RLHIQWRFRRAHDSHPPPGRPRLRHRSRAPGSPLQPLPQPRLLADPGHAPLRRFPDRRRRRREGDNRPRGRPQPALIEEFRERPSLLPRAALAGALSLSVAAAQLLPAAAVWRPEPVAPAQRTAQQVTDSSLPFTPLTDAATCNPQSGDRPLVLA